MDINVQVKFRLTQQEYDEFKKKIIQEDRWMQDVLRDFVLNYLEKVPNENGTKPPTLEELEINRGLLPERLEKREDPIPMIPDQDELDLKLQAKLDEDEANSNDYTQIVRDFREGKPLKLPLKECYNEEKSIVIEENLEEDTMKTMKDWEKDRKEYEEKLSNIGKPITASIGVQLPDRMIKGVDSRLTEEQFEDLFNLDNEPQEEVNDEIETLKEKLSEAAVAEEKEAKGDYKNLESYKRWAAKTKNRGS